MTQAKATINSLIHRTDRIQARLASAVEHAQAQAMHAAAGSGTVTPFIVASQVQQLNNQLGGMVTSFNTRLSMLDANIASRFTPVAARLGRATFAFSAPAQTFTTGVTSAVNSVATQVRNVTNAVTNPATVTSVPVGTNFVGVTAIQTFNNAFTQAANAINVATNSIDSTLAQTFGSFEAQFAANESLLLSTLNTTAQPIGAFPTGTGIAFPATTGTTGTIGNIGTTTTVTTGTGTTTTTTGTMTSIA
jgi:hypothetical protein